METIKEMNNEEFRTFCLMHNELKTVKENDYCDFINWVLVNCVEDECEVGFLDADSYYGATGEINEWESMEVSTEGEMDCWDKLYEMTGKDITTIEDDFLAVRFEDNENTMIATFLVDGEAKEYAIIIL